MKKASLATRKAKKGFYTRPCTVRPFSKERIPAQFVAQPSEHAQRLIAVETNPGQKAVLTVKKERGRSIPAFEAHLKRFKWFNKNRFEIIDQIAEGLVDHMTLGVVHRDLHPDNIVVSRKKDGKPAVKFIDYEGAFLADRRAIKGRNQEETKLVLTKDFKFTKDYVSWLSKDENEAKELNKYFRKKFEKLVKERL